MPISSGGPSQSSGSPISTLPNPWARSLADLLQPWTDALNDLSTTAAKNYDYCNDSLTFFQGYCTSLVGNHAVAFQGLGAQAFNKIYLLNSDQAGIINSKIQDFQKASHDLLTHIQNLNTQYELGKDGGIYWNAGPGNDPNSIVDSEFFAGTCGDNYIILSVLMDGFLTNTTIDDLLNPATADATIAAGIQIGANQITQKIEASYQAQRKDPSPFLDADHRQAIQTLQGFATNMKQQLQMWAEELYALAETYVQKVFDAGNMQELTRPLPPQSIGPVIPDPTQGRGAAKGASTTPTRATYLSQSDTVKGLPFSSNPTSNSASDPAINTVYVTGTDLQQLYNILTELQRKISAGSGVLANLLGGAASGAGIIASFIPVLGPALPWLAA